MNPVLLAVVCSLPWLLLPFTFVVRVRRSASLDEYDATPVSSATESSSASKSASWHETTPELRTSSIAPTALPRVSVVLPARNEARHIQACIVSLRASTWPDLEIIVVDDHSNDDTARLARDAAGDDRRVRVLSAPPLPDGWFGKQWACHVGAGSATGSVLLFTDADTRHAPELIARAVRARLERRADLLSVAGNQELRSFWELAIQPIVFTMILARYGGTRELEAARYPQDVIANGQCLMITREAYDAIGRHAAVRGYVAEDLMIAQRVHTSGRRVSLVLGRQQLSTRMYDNFSSLARGWMKNVYAGGRLAVRSGVGMRLLYPMALIAFPLLVAAPFIALVALLVTALTNPGSTSPSVSLAWWSAICSTATLTYFASLHAFGRTPVWRAVFAPVGALVFAGICVAAVLRGQRVEWKGRQYVAG